VEGDVPGAPSTPEQMKAFMERVVALEDEMEATGSFVFGGALHSPDASTVLRAGEGDVAMTDGPFVEAKEHIAGFYIINADDLDAALVWGRKVVEAIDHPIEVRPFRATGRVQA
ncbi:MAG: YciI family protein, partial [Actinomycetota bacterium]